MGKTYLSGRELKQFPTIGSLSELCGEHNPRKWGLCRKGDEVVFGKAKWSWILKVALNDLYERAHVAYGGEYNPNKVIIFYAIEPRVDYMECFLHELTSDDCIIQTLPYSTIKGVTYN